MTFLALPWFVLTTTGSTTKMGIVLAAELLPIALLGIPSGTVVTRLGAVKAMLVCDLARMPLMVSIPLLYEAGLLSFPLLLVLVFVLGCFIAPYFSAQRIVLPELVGEDSATLTQANAFVEAGSRLTILLGPVAAGLLIAWIGAVNVLYVDAATYAVSFCLLLFFVPRRRPVPVTAEGSGVLAGLRFVLSDGLLRPMLATAVFLHMFAQAIFVSLPVLAYDALRRQRADGRADVRRVRGRIRDRRHLGDPAGAKGAAASPGDCGNPLGLGAAAPAGPRAAGDRCDGRDVRRRARRGGDGTADSDHHHAVARGASPEGDDCGDHADHDLGPGRQCSCSGGCSSLSTCARFCSGSPSGAWSWPSRSR